VSIRATGAWELSALQDAWTAGGIAAVRDAVEAADRLAWERAGALDSQDVDQESGEIDRGAGRPPRPLGVGETPAGRRVLVHASGFKQSPYADIRPAGTDVRDFRSAASASGLVPSDLPEGPPRKLWHASPGSAGH
jgi:error-prone DNA polymerase